jgi:hypothetical protein
MEGVHEKDPWPITDKRKNTFDSPGDLIKGVLGGSGLGMTNAGQITHIPDAIGDGADDLTLIDLDQLDQLAGTLYPGAVYRIEYPEDTSGDSQNKTGSTTKIKLSDLINNMLLTHGLRSTWEYRESVRSWVMGFAKIDFMNTTNAHLTGSLFDESYFTSEAPRLIDSQHKFLKSINWEGTVNDQPSFINADSGIRQHVAAAEQMKIKDIAASYPNYDIIISEMVRLYKYLIVPPPYQEFGITPKGLARAAVGREVRLDWRALVNPSTGKRDTRESENEVNIYGLIEKAKLSLSRCDITVRVDESGIVGISPALAFSHTNASLSGSVISLTGLATSAANNDFANPNAGLTDLAYFDCYYFDKTTNSVTLNTECGCSDYRVTVIKRDQYSLGNTTAARNVWTGTISSVNVTAGTASITLDNTTNFSDSSGDYIVEFCDYDNANIQSCQKIYAFWGDSDGLITDSSGNSKKCATMV